MEDFKKLLCALTDVREERLQSDPGRGRHAHNGLEEEHMAGIVNSLREMWVALKQKHKQLLQRENERLWNLRGRESEKF